MSKGHEQNSTTANFNLMDTVLYLVAGCAMVFISFTFLLWLRF